MIDGISLGSWIRQQRLDRDLTQEELARLTACSLSTIRKIEADQRRPSRQLALQFARQFGLDSETCRRFIQWVRMKDLAAPAPAATVSLAVGPGRGRSPANLPTPPTSFVGRAQELQAIHALLLAPEVRLLTLTGPPGIGKTRLALQAAAELGADFPDGVWFVALAPQRDPQMLALLLARTLGVKETPGRPPSDALHEYLQMRRTLLVLDNFEQLLPAAPLLSDLLASTPWLKILVTSRATLDVYGEQHFPVAPLAVPAPESDDVEELDRYEAVRLFVERARAVRPDFTLTAENAPAVAAICARLEGLPLSIELAAARMRLFPLPGLLARLQNRLAVLTGSARDLPARQQTLRGALDWSYDLLEPDEQRLFCRLGVFVRGCTIEAAEAVCAEPAGCEEPVLSGLESLLAKSLLHQEERADGEGRFYMLETIRDYALERLAQSGDTAVVQRRHALYYLALAERAEAELTGRRQAFWLARLHDEQDNLRAALAWATEQGETELALRFGGALGRFWEVQGPVSEGRRWLEAALAQEGEVRPAVRAKALNAAGTLAFDEDDYAAATRLHRESLALRRALGDERGIAAALNSLGTVAHRQGDYGQAQTCFEESLARRRASSDRAGVGLTLINLGAVAADQGAYAQARTYLEESLARMEALGDKWGRALALHHLGEIELYEGDYERAARLLEESLHLFRELGDRRRSARALGTLGMLARKQTAYTRGQPFYQESLAIFRELGAKHGIAICLDGLAAVAGGQGEVIRAARLRGAAATIRQQIGAPPPPDPRGGQERRVSPGRVEVDPATLAAARAEGQRMSLDQAVVYALEGNVL